MTRSRHWRCCCCRRRRRRATQYLLRVGNQSRDATSVSVGDRDVIVDAGKMLTHWRRQQVFLRDVPRQSTRTAAIFHCFDRLGLGAVGEWVVGILRTPLAVWCSTPPVHRFVALPCAGALLRYLMLFEWMKGDWGEGSRRCYVGHWRRSWRWRSAAAHRRRPDHPCRCARTPFRRFPRGLFDAPTSAAVWPDAFSVQPRTTLHIGWSSGRGASTSSSHRTTQRPAVSVSTLVEFWSSKKCSLLTPATITVRCIH